MNTCVLASTEVCEFFESLSDARRAVVWGRVERRLGAPVSDFEADDERLDDAFDRVLTDMWCAARLDRLVELGRLQRGVAADGSLTFATPAA